MDTLEFDVDDNIFFYKNHPTWAINVSVGQLTVILMVNNTDKQLSKKSCSHHAGMLVLHTRGIILHYFVPSYFYSFM